MSALPPDERVFDPLAEAYAQIAAAGWGGRARAGDVCQSERPPRAHRRRRHVQELRQALRDPITPEHRLSRAAGRPPARGLRRITREGNVVSAFRRTSIDP